MLILILLTGGNLFFVFSKKVLPFLFCAATKANGSGRAVVVAGQAAGAVTVPFNVDRLLTVDYCPLIFQRNIVHRAYFDTSAAADAVGCCAERLVGNEVSAEERAKHIGLEPWKGASINVHNSATFFNMPGNLLYARIKVG